MPMRGVWVAVFVLGACQQPGQIEPEPTRVPAAATSQTATPPVRGSTAFDLDDFEAPFERLPLREAFIAAQGIGRVTLHRDRRIEDAWLTDIETIVTEYDDAGRPVVRQVLDRGEPERETKYHYEGDRLVRARETWSRGTMVETRYEYDASGRVADTWRAYESDTVHERNHYDDTGRLVRAEQIADGQTATKSFAYQDEHLVRVDLKTGDGEPITIRYRYDEAGRRIRQTQTRPNGPTDEYAFTWDAAGRLHAIEFTDSGKKIYRRSYVYDDRGRPTEERLESFVPAMGSGDVIRYLYEARGEPPRRPAATTKEGPSHAELVNATVDAFGGYVELAQVAYETSGEDRFSPHSVTVLVPEAVASKWTDEERKRRACAAKTAAGMGCGCERVEMGEAQDYAWHSWPDKRVVKVRLVLGLGC